jgi:hypothetical protein
MKKIFLLLVTIGLLVSPMMASAAPLEGGAKSGAITGTVFIDSNGNGKFDRGEAVSANTTVNLKPLGGGANQAVRSNSRGVYVFWGVAPGKYSLDANAPSGDGGAWLFSRSR